MTLIKTSILTAISSVIKMLAGFAINKILAVYAGPSGLAFIGQLQNFIVISTTASNGAITGGVVKYTAEYQSDEQKKYLFSTALKISFVCSIIVALILMIFKKNISLQLFGNLKFEDVILVLSLTITFFSLNTLLLSILNGQKEIKKYILSNISNSIFSLILITFFTYYLGLKGALYALVLNQSLVFFITLLFVLKSEWFSKDFFIQKYDHNIAYKLMKFSFMAIASIVSSLGSILFIRNYIGSQISWEAAGYWQGIMAISDAYLMVVVVSLSVYYLPRLSEIQNKRELRKEILNGFKIILPLVMVMALFIFLLKVFIIKVLFTSEFLPMVELFQWQLIGDVIKIASWLLSMVLVAKAMTLEFIYAEISTGILFVLLSVFLINKYGLVGVTYAFTINYIYYFLFMLIVNIKKRTII